MTTTITPPAESEATTPRPAGLSPRTAVWLLARRVHFLAGLVVAPFLAVLCLTGLAYAFTPQLNDLLYGKELFAGNHDGQPRALSEQVAAALAAHPEATLQSVRPPVDADRTTQVVLSVPGLADTGSAFSTEALTVYVDPYTNQVNGALVTVNNRPPAQVWLRELHGNLHLGEPGRLYSELVASWLPFLLIGGLIMWLGRRRGRRRARELLVPAPRRLRGRTRLRAMHGPLGLWLALGLLAVSITGLTWSSYAGGRVDAVVNALNAKSPSLIAPTVTAPPGAQPIGVDRVMEIARAEGLDGQLTITPPTAKEKPYKVSESFDTLPVRKDNIAIDPYTGRVTAKITWADYPLLAKLTSLGISAHTGTLLGLANQIGMALLAIGALVMLVLGYRMWWHRRPTGGKLAPAPPPVWPRLSHPVVFLAVLAMIAIGWAMPVFGVSLAAFIVLDTLLGATKRRRQATTT